jgi:hypothetical protein
MASPPRHEQAMCLGGTPRAQRLAQYDRCNCDQDGGVHATYYRCDVVRLDGEDSVMNVNCTVRLLTVRRPTFPVSALPATVTRDTSRSAQLA